MPTLKPYRKSPWKPVPVKRKISPDYDFYNSRQWRKISKLFLSDPINSVCIECRKEGRLDPATVTDHIIPIQHGGAKTDERNFQGLCRHHHAKKSAKESHGIVGEWKLNHNNEKIPK